MDLSLLIGKLFKLSFGKEYFVQGAFRRMDPTVLRITNIFLTRLIILLALDELDAKWDSFFRHRPGDHAGFYPCSSDNP